METLSKIPDKFIDCVITSPPYWQLRDYGHPDQWGLEPTFDEYLEHLWQMMDEIWRVLKDTGTVFINLGDTYGTKSGSMGSGLSDPKNPILTNTSFQQSKLIHKSLLLLPHRFAIGCIERKWLVRNDIIWAKRNAMPESVNDRFSKKHEYFFFMTKNENYYFDLEAIKDRTTTKDSRIRDRDTTKLNNTPGRTYMAGLKENNYDTKNPGSVSDFWDIPTKPSSEEHYAQYNDELLKKPVLAGCPEGGIIYDPFTGTGTTWEVSARAKRNFIGSELVAKNIEIANRRMEQFLMPKMF